MQRTNWDNLYPDLHDEIAGKSKRWSDLLAFSFVNKAARASYYRTLPNWFLRQAQNFNAKHGLMQLPRNRLTLNKLFAFPISKYQLRAVSRVLDFADDFLPVQRKIELLSFGKSLLMMANDQPAVWQLYLDILLLNFGLEREGDERELPLVTEANITEVKHFIASFVEDWDRDCAFRGSVLYQPAEYIQVAIKQFADCLYNTGFNNLSEQFRERMAVTMLVSVSRENSLRGRQLMEASFDFIESLLKDMSLVEKQTKRHLCFWYIVGLHDRRLMLASYTRIAKLTPLETKFFYKLSSERYNTHKSEFFMNIIMALDRFSQQSAMATFLNSLIRLENEHDDVYKLTPWFSRLDFEHNFLEKIFSLLYQLKSDFADHHLVIYVSLLLFFISKYNKGDSTLFPCVDNLDVLEKQARGYLQVLEQIRLDEYAFNSDYYTNIVRYLTTLLRKFSSYEYRNHTRLLINEHNHFIRIMQFWRLGSSETLEAFKKLQKPLMSNNQGGTDFCYLVIKIFECYNERPDLSAAQLVSRIVANMTNGHFIAYAMKRFVSHYAEIDDRFIGYIAGYFTPQHKRTAIQLRLSDTPDDSEPPAKRPRME